MYLIVIGSLKGCRWIDSRRSDGVGELSREHVGHPIGNQDSRLFEVGRVIFLGGVHFAAMATGVAFRGARNLI